MGKRTFKYRSLLYPRLTFVICNSIILRVQQLVEALGRRRSANTTLLKQEKMKLPNGTKEAVQSRTSSSNFKYLKSSVASFKTPPGRICFHNLVHYAIKSCSKWTRKIASAAGAFRGIKKQLPNVVRYVVISCSSVFISNN